MTVAERIVLEHWKTKLFYITKWLNGEEDAYGILHQVEQIRSEMEVLLLEGEK